MDFVQALEKHKEIFPLATVESQIDKFNEEFEELQNANEDEYADEYGDLMFVILSFRRFEKLRPLSKVLLNKYYFSKRVENRKQIMKMLAAAIKRCEKREYYYEHGIYKRNKGDSK